MDDFGSFLMKKECFWGDFGQFSIIFIILKEARNRLVIALFLD